MARGCGKPGIDNTHGRTIALALFLCHDTSARATQTSGTKGWQDIRMKFESMTFILFSN
jgi:hypothetical protein